MWKNSRWKWKFFVIGPFCTRRVYFPILFVLKLASNRAFFTEICFQFKHFQLKSSTPVFLKKVFVFQKSCSKSFKTSSDCHIKIYRFPKRRAILKIPRQSTVQKSLCFFCWLKMKPLKKEFSCVLRILSGEKHSQIKLLRLRKVGIWTFRSLVHQINSL